MGTINYMCCFSVKEYVDVLTKGLNLNRSFVPDKSYKFEVKSRLECTVIAYRIYQLIKDPNDPDQSHKKKNIIGIDNDEVNIEAVQVINDVVIERV